MIATRYRELAAALLLEAARIEEAKRPAYTIGSDNVLANFESVGDRVRVCCPECAHRFPIGGGPALAVYLLKHADAVLSALCDSTIPQGEPVLGRFADLVNYTKLGYAIVQARDEAPRGVD